MRNKILVKVAELLYIFLLTPDEVEKYFETMQSSSSNNCVCYYDIEILRLFDPLLQLINTKPTTENKLKELLNELKNFKGQSILVLQHKKKND